MEGVWIQRPCARPGAALRLLCIPHAGGTPGLFRSWTTWLPRDVEPLLVCLPGRETRLGESFSEDIPALIDKLAWAVRPLLDRPWAIFGHSMGAVLGHELALALARQGDRQLRHVFASARQPPQHHRSRGVHRLDDDGLCAELTRLGGTAPELLNQPEVREVILPAVRHDYCLIETYHARPEGQLHCPLTAFLGHDDTELTQQEALGWARWTAKEFRLQLFPGGHFYLADRPRDVVTQVLRSLGRSGEMPEIVSVVDENDNQC
ncbi:thioesterase [Alkalilimnicola ehrlichii]|uniref:Thioesterase n=1 Tax=Alkalilimnicola ehrlichii TaxID=351052 RepID=A0A3E0WUW6_9GAMM|nr:alpha/beta fold hydrolase [Alkalilimnicola ehrlichii]RFA28582.1 thioesterase [Alkalilimnicola ehrlichii]RFA35747.1 thioesterase [Alkalilimnicola ehrlichii]